MVTVFCWLLQYHPPKSLPTARQVFGPPYRQQVLEHRKTSHRHSRASVVRTWRVFYFPFLWATLQVFLVSVWLLWSVLVLVSSRLC